MYSYKDSFTHQLQMPYLVEFGCFVSKDIGATCTMAPLVVVVIHKHESITMRKETPRFS